MGTYSGPPSASDGLVFYLDATNSVSYSGSGNTFYNLVNASIGGSIVGYASTPIDNTQIKSLTFDGSNDFISVGSLGSFYTQGTISFWMKSLDITANYRNPFATNYNGLNLNVLRFEQGEGAGAFKCWFGDPSGTIASLSYSSISANTWYNVVLTWNQSTTTVTGYLNGVLDVNNSSWVRWPTSFVNVGIGLGYNSRYFLGNIGQVSIYNRALSASEIFQNYNASKKRYFPEENIVTNGLVLNIDPAKYSSYPGSGTTIYDVSGSGNTGVLTNGPTLFGLNGGSILLDGSNDYIEVPSISLNSSFTIDMFCNTNNISSTYVFVGKYGGGSYDFWLGVSGSRFKFSISMPNKFDAQTATISTNTWYHVAAVYNASAITASIYLNGVLAQTLSGSSVFQNPPGNYAIGAFGAGGGYYFPGNVAAHKLYNRALSASEIAQNFNALRGRYNI